MRPSHVLRFFPRFFPSVLLCAALAACGGGGDAGTAAEVAARSGTQPVACTGVTGLNCQ